MPKFFTIKVEDETNTIIKFSQLKIQRLQSSLHEKNKNFIFDKLEPKYGESFFWIIKAWGQGKIEE